MTFSGRTRARSFLSTLGRVKRRELVAWRWVLGLGGVAAVAWTVLFGSRARHGPWRCERGLVALGPRCCAEGQHLHAGRCRGQPRSCPPGLQLAVLPQPGCVATLEPARIGGGSVAIAPSDWESEGVITARRVDVESFKLDRIEVTIDAWRHCEIARVCEALPQGDNSEPGVPVTGVSAEQASRYCSFVGGRLPKFDELVFAAAGTEARRFPWGAHGLVCRRAAFGLVDGPCGRGAVGPELAGSRPGGASPDGVLDLVGNVAEWSEAASGTWRLFGGSYQSKVASQLKSWSAEPPHQGDHAGFRCAYDLAPGQ